jgi:hypothetical protein
MPSFISSNLVFSQKRYSGYISIQERNIRHGKSNICTEIWAKAINNAVTSLHDGSIVGKAVLMP